MLVAKFGYWESLHLFSSLTILLLSRVVNIPEPLADENQGGAALALSPNDFASPRTTISVQQGLVATQLYTEGRALLDEMAAVGNLAAKDHAAWLADIEGLVQNIAGGEGGTAPVLPNTYPAWPYQDGEVPNDISWDEQWVYTVDWNALFLGDDLL